MPDRRCVSNSYMKSSRCQPIYTCKAKSPPKKRNRSRCWNTESGKDPKATQTNEVHPAIIQGERKSILMESSKTIEHIVSALTASFAKESHLPDLRDRLEVEMADQP